MLISHVNVFTVESEKTKCFILWLSSLITSCNWFIWVRKIQPKKKFSHSHTRKPGDGNGVICPENMVHWFFTMQPKTTARFIKLSIHFHFCRRKILDRNTHREMPPNIGVRMPLMKVWNDDEKQIHLNASFFRHEFGRIFDKSLLRHENNVISL